MEQKYLVKCKDNSYWLAEGQGTTGDRLYAYKYTSEELRSNEFYIGGVGLILIPTIPYNKEEK